LDREIKKPPIHHCTKNLAKRPSRAILSKSLDILSTRHLYSQDLGNSMFTEIDNLFRVLFMNKFCDQFCDQLKNRVSVYSVLKHPYYQAWNEGELSKDSLKLYARQYFKHVDQFPRYISAIHSLCEDLTSRQILLENLIDEERGEDNHPELWLKFAECLGNSRDSVYGASSLPETRELVSEFMQLCQSSYEEGLGALYAYEHQVPEVAKTKIAGLQKYYGLDSDAALKFFRVHETADVYHSEAVEGLLNSLSDAQKGRASLAAEKAAKLLWKFLDGICEASHQDFEKFGYYKKAA